MPWSTTASAGGWTEPVAHLRLAAPASGGVLAIDTGGRRGAPLDCVSGVYVGARRVRNRRLGEDGTRLLVPLNAGESARAAREGLSILSRPLEPWRSGSEDPRRLGLPVCGIELVSGDVAVASRASGAALSYVADGPKP